MTLSERTNATILNTLNGVRHNPLLPSPYPWVALLDSPLCLLACLFCVWPPCPLGWALFAPVWTFLRLLFFGLSKSDCFVFHLGSFVCVATGASVHRRGRCIGVSPPLANDTSLVLVLVCLSVDVTGALALPNSFLR